MSQKWYGNKEFQLWFWIFAFYENIWLYSVTRLTACSASLQKYCRKEEITLEYLPSVAEMAAKLHQTDSQVPGGASAGTSKLQYLYQQQHYFSIQLGSNIISRHSHCIEAITDTQYLSKTLHSQQCQFWRLLKLTKYSKHHVEDSFKELDIPNKFWRKMTGKAGTEHSKCNQMISSSTFILYSKSASDSEMY